MYYVSCKLYVVYYIVSVARIGEGRGAYRILVGRPDGRRPLQRMDWIDMAQDRDRWRALVSAVRNLQVP
jgi:hypothetical protein